MLWTVFDEQPSAKDNLVITLREGLIMTSRVTTIKVFGELLSALKNPETVEREPLVKLVTDILKGIVSLFGANSGGALRLKTWLDRATSQTSDIFTREEAVKELREFFPLQMEVDRTIYGLWAMEDLDKSLQKGISNWQEKPAGVTPAASLSSIASSSSHPGPSNPYAARLSYSERARMGQL